MPTFDRQNPLTFPVRIFDALAITTDPKTGEVRHEGDFVEFHRKAEDPKPTTLAEAEAILKRQLKKDATLVAIVTKARPGKTHAQRIIEAVKELRASTRPEAVKWKAEAKAVEVTGGSVVAVEAKPVEEVKPAVGDGIAPDEVKAVGDGTAVEVKPAPKESPK